MVKQITRGKTVIFECEECKFAYKDRKWAEKCQDWCKKYHSCNTDITKNAIFPSSSK